MSMTMLTWQHYVQNVCKNVINMSKNHRHYVHLCTESRQDYSSLLSHSVYLWKYCMMPACNKSQYVINTFLNTFGRHSVTTGIMWNDTHQLLLNSQTKYVWYFSACDDNIMGTEIQQKKIPSNDKCLLFVFTIVSDTYTLVILLGCQSMVCGK